MIERIIASFRYSGVASFTLQPFICYKTDLMPWKYSSFEIVEVLFLSFTHTFGVQVNHQILNAWWVIPLQWMGVIWRDYSTQSDIFTNQYKATTHLPNIDIFLYYYYIRQKLTVYEQKIQFLCLGQVATYGSILPIVTKMIV